MVRRFLAKNIDAESFYYNAFLLELLKPAMTSIHQQWGSQQLNMMNWLDVGSRNFSYLPALTLMAQKFSHQINITGIELDAYRRYSDGYYRWQYAEAFQIIVKYYLAANTQSSSFDSRYLVGDLLNFEELIPSLPQFDLVSYILPFVLPYALTRWGLPSKYLKPEQHLQKIAQLLKPNGQLIWVNLTEEEWLASIPLFDSKQWRPVSNYFFKSNWVDSSFDHKSRWVSVWEKK